MRTIRWTAPAGGAGEDPQAVVNETLRDAD
jgi:hypothetical protein